jgi:hypothetical protein
MVMPMGVIVYFVGTEAETLREKQFLMEVLNQKIQTSESRLADITGNGLPELL